MGCWARALLTTIALLVAAASAAQDLQRGFRYYQDIAAGRKRIEQLSPAEVREVL
ncbi:hypothetical protein [Ramlibacter sp.]|uniref:hypothetical protein n=1 Tax=Ramlibacter sp. TaxID=1917967 RepID=UPI0026144F2C|nr:hypothetical protein [Ramlibacter sp.]MDB5955300.1 hypothetical protein [Ramlibacter sp.]